MCVQPRIWYKRPCKGMASVIPFWSVTWSVHDTNLFLACHVVFNWVWLGLLIYATVGQPYAIMAYMYAMTNAKGMPY